MPILIYIPATAECPAHTFYSDHTHLFFCSSTDCANVVDYNGDSCKECTDPEIPPIPALETYCPDCGMYSVLDDGKDCDCMIMPALQTYCPDCGMYSVLDEECECECIQSPLDTAYWGGPCRGCGIPGLYIHDDVCDSCDELYNPSTPLVSAPASTPT